MGKRGIGRWAGLSLNLVVSLGLVACGSDTDAGGPAMGGSGGAQPGTGGAEQAGSGGASGGGSGAVAECQDGLQVLAVEPAPQATVESAPDHTAVVALIRGAAAPNTDIFVYRDLALLGPGEHPQGRHFTADDLGLSSLERLAGAKVFQNELFVAAPEGVAVATLDGSAMATLLSSPLGTNLFLAPGDGFLAVSSRSDFAIAKRAGEAWQWTSTLPFPDARNGRVIGSLGHEVLISLEEQRVSAEDGTSRFISAELVRVSLEGEVLARYPTRGNAVALMERDGGLLVSEVNSFWGSLKAALEWLEPGGDELRNLSDVPVISSTDGDDGAFATAVIDDGAAGEVLYIANGESGLRRGAWSTDALTLDSVRGAWDGQSGWSSGIGSLASAGGVLVVPGVDQKLYFLKACSEE